MTLGVGLSFPRVFNTAWSPLRLFQNNEVGAWYDPSDYTTLFQDSAGTTPVTAVEQPVGLMLDKSKGLALGADIAINGNFASGSTGWNATGTPTWVISGGVASIGSATGGNRWLQSTAFSLVIGLWYRVTMDVVCTAGGVLPDVAATNTNATTSGTKTWTLLASTTQFQVLANGSFVGSVTNIKVQVLSGNHASQSTSTKRPVLRARYNLLTYSEQLNNAAWGTWGGSVSADQTTAPDGTSTADLFTEDTSSGSTARHGVGRGDFTAAPYNSGTWTFSWYVKKKDRNYAFITLNQGSGTYRYSPIFDLVNGTVVAQNTTGTPVGTSASITSVGSAWWRITATGTSGTGGFSEAYCGMSNSATPSLYVSTPIYTGDGTSGMYIWGAMVNFGTSATPYQQITTATSYNSTGFLPYLAFDGVDDALATASIDFTGTNKMSVFAGVTKKIDSSVQIVAELTQSDGSVNGSWDLGAAVLAQNDWSFRSRGTTRVQAYGANYVAPITNVVTGLADIGSPSCTIRVNGTQIQSVTTSQGTGNYANDAVYIGSRAGTSLPLNGNLYSLIIRGATTSAADIATTETWVNNKTGAWTVPAASLNLQFAGATSLDPSITFTRSSSATYVGSNGLIQTAAINAPRFAYDPTTLAPLGLLVEEARTNYVLYSEQFDNATGWSKTAATVTADSTIAPNGTQTADTIVGSGSGQRVMGASVSAAGTTLTWSVYVKSAGGSGATLLLYNTTTATNLGNHAFSGSTFSDAGGTLTGTVTSVGNGWYRVTVTATSGITIGNLITPYIYSDNAAGSGSASSLYVWGAQLEAASTASSYIPTTSASVTRSADVATITSIGSWYVSTQGTWVAQLTMPSAYNNGRVIGYASSRTPLQVQSPGLGSYWGGGEPGYVSVSVSTSAKGGFVFSGSIAVSAANGSLGTPGSPTIPSQSTIWIGSDQGSGNFLNSTIASITYYPAALPGFLLQQYTT